MKQSGYKTKWLSGTSDPSEAHEEAQSLVDDSKE